jgi:hypothetical protein
MSFKLFVGTGQFVENEVARLLPRDIELFQNFPNPFNPTTSISFKIPRDAHVRLEVFSVLGQSVKLLVDGHTRAGVYSVLWDGSNRRGQQVSSGMYFYRMAVDGNPVRTNTMILTR